MSNTYSVDTNQLGKATFYLNVDYLLKFIEKYLFILLTIVKSLFLAGNYFSYISKTKRNLPDDEGDTLMANFSTN